MAHLGLGIGLSAVQVLQSLQELGAQSGSDAAVEGVLQTVVAGHHALDGTLQGGLHFAQGGDLHAGNAVVAGEAVGSVGESHCTALAVGGDGLVDGGYGTLIVVVVAAEYSFKKCHGISSYVHSSSRSRISLIRRISSIAVGLKS